MTLPGVGSDEVPIVARTAPASGERRSSRSVYLAPGETLGPYVVIDLVAEGSMGVLYRARHRTLGRIVALKVPWGPGRTQDGLSRFEREATLAAGLDADPHLATVFDFGMERGIQWLAMRWIDGRTFDRWVADLPGGARASPRALVRPLLPAIRAMGRFHRAGIVHRDVKPRNLMIDTDGGIHIVDFGVARDLRVESRLTLDGNPIGTPLYMSPEQAKGRPDIGPPSDVHAFGCVLYEAFAGSPPFSGGGDLPETLRLIDEEPAPPLANAWPECPRDLEAIVARCLEKVPAHRYPDCLALADDLERWLEGRPVEAPPVARAPRRRLRGLFLAGSAATIAIGIAAVVLVRHRSGPDDERPERPVGPVRPAPGSGPWLVVESREPDLAIAIRRVDPGTLEIRRDDALLDPAGPPPSPGPYAVEVAAPGRAPLLYRVEVPRSAAGIPRGPIRLSLPALPRREDVPEGMVFISPGQAILGAWDAKDALPEGPRTLPAFLIDAREVTNRDWAAFVSEGGGQPPPSWGGAAPPDDRLDLPVTGVTWQEATDYATWAGKRLPTEEEWERAGRWFDGRPFPWGTVPPTEDLVNAGRSGLRLLPAGNRAGDRSPEGVLDLAGNACEWTDSKDQRDPGLRIVRGSSFAFNAEYQGQALAHLATRWTDDASARKDYVGFRCARDP